MKIIYIGHSGFAIELPNRCAVIIDYYTDEAHIADKILSEYENIYVLSSHFHQDHFNPEILEWGINKPGVKYILSSDIRRKIKNKVTTQNISYIKEGETMSKSEFELRAFGSTDIGVSFMITTHDNKNIFHAGDLNDWSWKDESTTLEIEQAHKAFMRILKQIHLYASDVFVAMFPVDSRMGTDYEAGAKEFVHKFRVENFIPMHFWDNWRAACDFNKYKNSDYGAYHCMHNPGQSITIL